MYEQVQKEEIKNIFFLIPERLNLSFFRGFLTEKKKTLLVINYLLFLFPPLISAVFSWPYSFESLFQLAEQVVKI